MKQLFTFYEKNKEVQDVIQGLQSGLKEQLISGLVGSSRTVLFSSIQEKLNRTQCVVTANLLSAQKLYQDYIHWIDEKSVWLYPAEEIGMIDVEAASPELKAARIEILGQLIEENVKVLIVPVSGLFQILPPKEVWKDFHIPIQVGMDLDWQQFLQRLQDMGYEKEEVVSSPGTYCMRGGIIDIYPLTEENPVRIELFDTEIDSIRSFDTETQRSIQSLDKVMIMPATEWLRGKEIDRYAAKRLKSFIDINKQKIKNQESQEKVILFLNEMIHRFENHMEIPHFFKFAALLYEKPASLLDYMPADVIVFADELPRVMEQGLRLEREAEEYTVAKIEQGTYFYGGMLGHAFSDLVRARRFQMIYLSTFVSRVALTSPQNLVSIASRTVQDYHGQLHRLKSEMSRYNKGKYFVYLFVKSKDRLQKVASVLEDFSIDYYFLSDDETGVLGKINMAIGELQNGFEVPSMRLVVMSEADLFKKFNSKPRMKRQKISNAERIQSYQDLKVGDYVVHINHGVGKFLGIRTLEMDGIHKDYLHIAYQGDDVLYVPIDQFDQVQKYTGTEGKEPKIYKLGGSSWEKVKKKAYSQAADIAADLIQLYAARQVAKGHAFSPDGEQQRAFEALFPYEETDDQLRSVEEIKTDMEKEQPMDRLLCGDVGYGKTEVALRAAFKAIMDGKQVAMLVPTTILAQQHYQNIIERFQEFPINIALLNRFVTAKKVKEIKKGLKEGTVDMLVGTHKILAKDVVFKDLGLLIIDEEQRFGVRHKEKIKQMKNIIDVLTLSATPIPRTLHMSMLGIRDLSILETPPANRYPIQTYVIEYEGEIIREAIEREIARDGQVYFLYNRVEDIELKAEEISMLVSDARVGIAHGRMSETELEAVILDFLDRQYDVLVCTTIIETGIDIPNVNTLIVFDSDRMGLSQLYQLRGRVGRSNRVAYAYFTYKKDKVLTEVSERRLQSIKEFTELGSGFKIAMRDLAIRGTGTLLGAQQHGFIESVGFELFSQMIKESIDAKLVTNQSKPKQEIQIDLELDAYIPDVYIPDYEQKIEMYKKIQSIQIKDELFDVQDELMDRFGTYPKPVGDLLQIAEIKVYGYQLGLLSIKKRKNILVFRFSDNITKEMDMGTLYKEMYKVYGKKYKFMPVQDALEVELSMEKIPREQWLEKIKNFMLLFQMQ